MGRVAFPWFAFAACLGPVQQPAQQPVPVAAKVALEGRVIDLRGEPVPAANVRVLSPREPHAELARGVADAAGVFRIASVPSEAWWRVEAELSGRFAGAATGAGDPAVAIVHVHEVTTVTGVLRDGAGKPVAGATVRSFPAWWGPRENLRVFRDAKTDAEGRFVLDGVPLGATRLAAVVPGEGLAEVSVLVAPGCTAALAPIGGPTTAITVEIPGVPATALAAAVVTITAYTNNVVIDLPPPWHSPPFGAKGTWSISGVPDYEYRVTAHVPGYVIPSADTLLRTRGPHHVELRAAPRDVSTLPCRLRVVDEQGAPVAGVPLRVFAGPESLDFVDATTDAEGSAVFASVCATGSGYGFTSLDARFQLLADTKEPFDPARQTELRAVRTRQVTGRVELADGRPAAFAPIAIGHQSQARHQRWQYFRSTVTTDADGRFTIHYVGHAGGRLLIQDPRGCLESDALAFDAPGGTRELPPLVLAPPASVEGVVRDANGSPAAGIRVRVSCGEDLLLAHDTITDSRGRYRFPCLPKGPASLRAYPPLAESHVRPELVVGKELEAGRVHTLDLQVAPK